MIAKLRGTLYEVHWLINLGLSPEELCEELKSIDPEIDQVLKDTTFDIEMTN
jgi:hypothetical protein